VLVAISKCSAEGKLYSNKILQFLTGGGAFIQCFDAVAWAAGRASGL